MSLTIQQLTKLVLDQAKKKGFGIKPKEINVAEKIALIHSEVSEAYQAYREKRMEGKDGFKEELGDTIQRILHLRGVLDIDIEKAILTKLRRNKKRMWRWGKMNESHK